MRIVAATTRDRVRAALEHADLLAGARRVRHLVRTRGGLTDRGLVRRYLASTPEPRLHLGCGTRLHDGWLNTDWSPRTTESARIDLRRPLPFADETFSFVYGEHVIEHLDVAAARRLCAEIRRVLRPGGVVRLATPDLDRLIRLLRTTPPLEDVERRYVELIRSRCWPDEPLAGTNPVFTLNNNVRDWGHRFIWDEPTFRQLLGDAGLGGIERCGLQESRHEPLRGLANETRMPPGLVDFETMTFEATRR